MDTLKKLKEWWWLVGVVVGGIILWGNLPARVAKAEEQIDDLKAWSRELMGYTRAQEQMNQMQMQQVPRYERHWDADAQRYWCSDGYQDWWADADGRCE